MKRKNKWFCLALGFICLSGALLARPGSALSVTRSAAIEKICRTHRLDCSELKEAVLGVMETGRLPAKWITKKQANELGWSPGVKLGKVAPGKSIGGDRFGNRERRLPVVRGRTYFEADLGYKGSKRNATRLIYSSDKLFYVTADHYKTFEAIPE